MFPAYENGLFSLDLERIVFVYVIKKGCDSVVLHAVCPPPKVIRESLLEVIDSFIRCHTEKKRITDKDGKILMENVVKVLNPFKSATEQLSNKQGPKSETESCL